MIDLPNEALLGIAYGLLTGFVPALFVGFAAIGAVIGWDEELPPLAGGAVAVPFAVGTGTMLGVFVPTDGPAAVPRMLLGGGVVMTLGVVATTHGTTVARNLPQDRAAVTVRGASLGQDAIDAVDAAGQVTIRSSGQIRTFDGCPSPSPALRERLEAARWRFPADLQLAEIERRLAVRLKHEHDLSLVDVSVDGRGIATLTVAPSVKGVASTLDDGHRAVTVTGLVPTGIEPGDRVMLGTSADPVKGDVLAVGERGHSVGDAGPGVAVAERPLTVAVDTADARLLLDDVTYRIAVVPSGENHEFEVTTLLEETGHPVRITEGERDHNSGIEPIAVRGEDDQWQFSPDEIDSPARQAFVAEPQQGGGTE